MSDVNVPSTPIAESNSTGSVTLEVKTETFIPQENTETKRTKKKAYVQNTKIYKSISYVRKNVRIDGNRITRSTIVKWCTQGLDGKKLNHKLVGNSIRIRPEDIRKFLKNNPKYANSDIALGKRGRPKKRSTPVSMPLFDSANITKCNETPVCDVKTEPEATSSRKLYAEKIQKLKEEYKSTTLGSAKQGIVAAKGAQNYICFLSNVQDYIMSFIKSNAIFTAVGMHYVNVLQADIDAAKAKEVN